MNMLGPWLSVTILGSANRYGASRAMFALRLANFRRFPELSYANVDDPFVRRWIIRGIERLSGREYFAGLYESWRTNIVGHSQRIMSEMLQLIDIRLEIKRGEWPPREIPAGPLVMIANHPYGIGDGIAILSLAEQLGRPYRVLIHKDLLKVSEIRPYALPVDFADTREALAMNLDTRRNAVRLLKEGVVIVVFPAGGVATAPRGFGRAVDLPWKIFPARMIQAAKASVVPVYFEGQNGMLFHLVSKVSLTARLSLLIREFRRLVGKTITAHIGEIIAAETLAGIQDRKQLTHFLHECVFSMRMTQSGI